MPREIVDWRSVASKYEDLRPFELYPAGFAPTDPATDPIPEPTIPIVAGAAEPLSGAPVPTPLTPRTPTASTGYLAGAAMSGGLPEFKTAEVAKTFKTVSPELKAAVAATPVPVTITSARRSAGQNKAVGGVPTSYHLTGQAVDVRTRGKSAEEIKILKQHFRSQGFEVIDEGDHLHVEPARGRSRGDVAGSPPVSIPAPVSEDRPRPSFLERLAGLVVPSAAAAEAPSLTLDPAELPPEQQAALREAQFGSIGPLSPERAEAEIRARHPLQKDAAGAAMGFLESLVKPKGRTVGGELKELAKGVFPVLRALEVVSNVDNAAQAALAGNTLEKTRGARIFDALVGRENVTGHEVIQRNPVAQALVGPLFQEPDLPLSEFLAETITSPSTFLTNKKTVDAIKKLGPEARAVLGNEFGAVGDISKLRSPTGADSAAAKLDDLAEAIPEGALDDVVGKVDDVADSLPIGGGSPPAKSEKFNLVAAAIGDDGKLYYGAKGETHADLLNKFPDKISPATLEKTGGYAGSDGKYLTRDQGWQALDDYFKNTPITDDLAAPAAKEIPDELAKRIERDSMIQLRHEIDTADAGKRIVTDTEDFGTIGTRQASTFPIQDLGSKKSQMSAIEKYLKGEDLTDNQKYLVDEMLKHVRKQADVNGSPYALIRQGLEEEYAAVKAAEASVPPGSVDDVPFDIPPAQQERGFITTIKESPRTAPEVAQAVEGSYTPLVNQETLDRARDFVARNYDDAVRMVKSPEPGTADTYAMAQVLVDRAQNEGRFQDAIDLVEITARKATEQGQAIQALSMWNRLTPSGILRYAERQLAQANAAREGLDLSLTPELSEKLTTMAKEIALMPEGRAKAVATAEMLQNIANQIPSKLRTKIGLIQTMGQLLNPKTAIRNIVGNLGFAVGENVSDVVGSGVDFLTGLVTGKRTKALPSLGAQVKGGLRGLSEGVDDALRGIDTASYKTQFELPKSGVFKGKVGRNLEKLLNIELKATDRAFYQAAYDGSLAAQMKAAKVAKPTEEMLEVAHHDALYRTFQDENATTKVFTGIKKALNLGQDFGLGDFIIKYPKTPANLLNRGVAYSPAGFINTLWQAARPLMGKSFNQKAFVESFSRALVGSGSLVGTGALLHRLGIITGRPSSDKEIRGVEREAGLGAYRINVSALKRFVLSGGDAEAAGLQKGDKLVSYDWFQPFAISVSLGANLDESGGKPGLGTAAAIAESVKEGVNTLSEQPLISGLTRAIKTGKPVDAITETAKDAPASFIPTLSKQVSQAIDNTSRETYDPDPIKESVNQVKAKIPGLAQTLRPRITLAGKEQEVFQDGKNNFFNVFLNPAFISEFKPTPEAELVLNLYRETGETKQAPKLVGKTSQMRGIELTLSPEQREKLQRYVGTMTSETFRAMANDPEFAKMSDYDKLNELSAKLTEIGKIAKVRILGKEFLAESKKKGEVEGLLTQQEIEDTERGAQAEAEMEKFKALPSKEEKLARLKEVKTFDPKLFEKLKDKIKDQKAGLTYEDRKIKALGVENGYRADYILGMLQDMPTREHKVNYLRDLKAKGLLSPEVIKQMKKAKKDKANRLTDSENDLLTKSGQETENSI